MKRLPFVAICLALTASAAWAADIRALIQKCKPAVVQIATFDKEGKLLGTGTGFFVSADGYLVTNAHVVNGINSILARDFKGTVFHVFWSKDAWVEFGALSPQDPDVILLRADATNVPYLTLGSTTSAVEGQRVLVIGNPEGLEFTVSDGIISAFRENRAYIQITAPISLGSSGSPVLDADSGQVLGIAVGIWKEGQNLNFAIPSEKIREVIAKTGFISQTPPVAVTTPTPWQPPEADFKRAKDLADVKFYKAFEKWKAKDYENAVTDFDTVIQLSPSSARAWALRGDAQRHLKHFGNAIRDYTEAIRLSPGSDFSYEGRSAVFEILGDHVKAAQDLRKAEELRRKK
jgi:hypothetical protein